MPQNAPARDKTTASIFLYPLVCVEENAPSAFLVTLAPLYLRDVKYDGIRRSPLYNFNGK